MFRRGNKVWSTAALVGVLLFTAGSGRAMAWQGPVLPLTGWETAWDWIASWLGVGRHTAAAPIPGRQAARGAQEKSSLGIDPLGLAAPTNSVQSDSSSSIDPNGHS